MNRHIKFGLVITLLLTVAVVSNSDPEPAHGRLASSSMHAVIESKTNVPLLKGIFMVLDEETGRVVWQSEAAGVRGTRNGEAIHFSTSVPSSLDHSDGLIHAFRLDSRRANTPTYIRELTLQFSNGAVHSSYATNRNLQGRISETKVENK